jgi:cytochrome c peroxidase
MKKYLTTFILCGVALLCIAATTAINGSGLIDLGALDNYANQPLPNYIAKDNTPLNNEITDLGATLGRVLFYDKQLSINNTVSCSSCHQQAFGFSDTALSSAGVNGLTGRHSMRIINSRFSNERRFFWDERAASLEAQTTQPIQDHAEMGFSGQNGDPDLDSLIRKMDKLQYYQDLFYAIYGDVTITEARMQSALAQFIRSIQSFDAKYDVGRAQVQNDGVPFPNFTMQENQGKALFLGPAQFNMNGVRTAGGAGCGACHRPPEFDIANNTLHNGMIRGIDGNIDLENTRSPSLRNLVGPNGSSNGPFMHNGALRNLEMVVNHYNQLPIEILDSMLYFNSMDPRLRPNGNLQNLNLTQAERDALVAFLLTLTGSEVYTDPRWSDPFDSNGNLNILNSTLSIEEDLWEEDELEAIQLYPNPTAGELNIDLPAGEYEIRLRDIKGVLLQKLEAQESTQIMMTDYPAGLYFIQLTDPLNNRVKIKKIIKN